MTSLHPVRFALGALLLAAALSFSPEAHVSQVHNEGMPLEAALSNAAMVVVGHLAEPAVRLAESSYTLTTTKGEPHTGTYTVVMQRVVVERVLHPAGAPVPKEPLEVYSPDAMDMFHLTLEYERSGLSKSPIFFNMEGGVNLQAPEQAGKSGIFLLGPAIASDWTATDHPEAWAALGKAIAGARPLTMSDAVAPMQQLDRVTALLEGEDAGASLKPNAPAPTP